MKKKLPKKTSTIHSRSAKMTARKTAVNKLPPEVKEVINPIEKEDFNKAMAYCKKRHVAELMDTQEEESVTLDRQRRRVSEMIVELNLFTAETRREEAQLQIMEINYNRRQNELSRLVESPLPHNFGSEI